MFSTLERSIIEFIQDRKDKIIDISQNYLTLEINESFSGIDKSNLPLFLSQQHPAISLDFNAFNSSTPDAKKSIFRSTNLQDFQEELIRFSDAPLSFKHIFKIKTKELFKPVVDYYNIKINFFKNLTYFSKNINDTALLSDTGSYNKSVVFLLEDLKTDEVIQNDLLEFYPIDKFNLSFFDNLNDVSENSQHFNKYESVKSIFDKPELKFSELPSLWIFDNSHPILDTKYLNSFIALIANSFYEDTYSIKGQHNLKYQMKPLTKTPDVDFKIHLEEILSKLLDSERHFEKLLIARTAITTYIKNETSTEEFTQMSPEILDTFEHHFDQYVQNEVKVFLEQKNNVMREVLKVADKINQEIANIQKDSRKYIFSSTITILASLFLKINISNDTLDNTYAWNLLSMAIAFSMGYFILHLAEQFLNESKKSVGRLTTNFRNYFSKVSSNKTKNFTHDNIYSQFLASSIDAFNDNYSKLVILITYLKLIIIALFCVFCSLQFI